MSKAIVKPCVAWEILSSTTAAGASIEDGGYIDRPFPGPFQAGFW